MISWAFALALAAPPEIPDEPALAEEPAYEADTSAVTEEPVRRGGLTEEQLALMKQAIAKAEAERVAENAARAAMPTQSPLLLNPTYTPPSPVSRPSPARPSDPQCSGPLCIAQPVPDWRSGEANSPAVDTRPTTSERIAQLLPVAWTLAAFGIAFALWRFMRPRWRGYVPIGRRIITGYWREIGLFTMLAAIFLKLW